jgi:hypothetical protein
VHLQVGVQRAAAEHPEGGGREARVEEERGHEQPRGEARPGAAAGDGLRADEGGRSFVTVIWFYTENLHINENGEGE